MVFSEWKRFIAPQGGRDGGRRQAARPDSTRVRYRVFNLLEENERARRRTRSGFPGFSRSTGRP